MLPKSIVLPYGGCSSRAERRSVAPEVAGSNPVTHPIQPVWNQRVSFSGAHRLHDVSTDLYGIRGFEEPDRAVDRRRTEVHVPQGRAQTAVSSQLLNRPRRRPAHRECLLARGREHRAARPKSTHVPDSNSQVAQKATSDNEGHSGTTFSDRRSTATGLAVSRRRRRCARRMMVGESLERQAP